VNGVAEITNTKACKLIYWGHNTLAIFILAFILTFLLVTHVVVCIYAHMSVVVRTQTYVCFGFLDVIT